MYDGSNRKDVRRQEKQAKLADQQRREIIYGIMSVQAGRRWMLEELEACHVFATSFSSDAIRMAFLEGERNRGLRLLNDIMAACPDEYILMMRERNERDLAERQRSEKSDGRDIGRVPGEERYAADEVDGSNEVRVDDNYVKYTADGR